MSENNNPFPDTKFTGTEFSKSDMTGAKFNGVLVTDLFESYEKANNK